MKTLAFAVLATAVLANPALAQSRAASPVAARAVAGPVVTPPADRPGRPDRPERPDRPDQPNWGEIVRKIEARAHNAIKNGADPAEVRQKVQDYKARLHERWKNAHNGG